MVLKTARSYTDWLYRTTTIHYALGISVAYSYTLRRCTQLIWPAVVALLQEVAWSLFTSAFFSFFILVASGQGSIVL